MARAASSLPAPLSPKIKTGSLLFARSARRWRRRQHSADSPMMPAASGSPNAGMKPPGLGSSTSRRTQSKQESRSLEHAIVSPGLTAADLTLSPLTSIWQSPTVLTLMVTASATAVKCSREMPGSGENVVPGILRENLAGGACA